MKYVLIEDGVVSEDGDDEMNLFVMLVEWKD